MSTALTLANIVVPAHIAARMNQQSTLAASISSGLSQGESFPRVSIKGSRFRIVEGKTETVLEQTKLNVVIVGANPRLSKTFYAKQWDPNDEATGPDCFSLDGIGPDTSVQNPENDLCASCPKNAWGSKIAASGQQVKACSDQKRLAIVAAEDPDGPTYLLQVTPAALKGLNQYQKELSVRGIPPEVVKTTLSFDTDASFPKLKFSFGGFLEAHEQSVVDALFGSEGVKEITGEKLITAHSVDAVAHKAPAAAPKPVSVEVAPKVEAAPEAEEWTDILKRGFGAAKPAPAPVVEAAKVVKPKAAPAPVAVAADTEAMSLADEIAALVGGLDSDD